MFSRKKCPEQEGKVLMFEKVRIPSWLYRSWPWLCLAASGGYAGLGLRTMASLLATYGLTILITRYGYVGVR